MLPETTLSSIKNIIRLKEPIEPMINKTFKDFTEARSESNWTVTGRVSRIFIRFKDRNNNRGIPRIRERIRRPKKINN